LPALQRQ